MRRMSHFSLLLRMTSLHDVVFSVNQRKGVALSVH